MSIRDEPETSCPYLDASIDGLEKARGIAEELRSWALKGWEKVEELEYDVSELEILVAKLEKEKCDGNCTE